MEQITIEPYSTMYEKLLKIIPDLPEHLAKGTHYGKSELNSPGMMDVHFDYLGSLGKGQYIISLAHHFEQNDDLVADPDMEIRVVPEMKIAEAISFQNQFTYQRVYKFHDGGECVSPKLKKDLNSFLNQWLSNMIDQGHIIDLGKSEREQNRAEEIEQTRNKDSTNKENDRER